MSGLVVQEWMEPIGGAERVVKSLLKLREDTQLFCLWANSEDPDLESVNITESWLAKSPLAERKALALPLMSATWRNSKLLIQPDWLFVSSHLFAHHVSLNKQFKDLPGINYIHSPARYLWSPELDGRASKPALNLAVHAFKLVDKKSAERSTFKYLANSKNVQARIKQYWGIDSEVLYPPVRVDELKSQSRSFYAQRNSNVVVNGITLPSEYLIGVGRFVPYKRLDEVIRVASKAGLPAVLIGSGKLEQEYTKLASSLGVELVLLKGLSDVEVAKAIYFAQALIFPGIEDFGIVPVEAMALGTPVLARDLGGARETVVDGVGGFLIDDFDDCDIKRIITEAQGLPRDLVSASVASFDEGVFALNADSFIGKLQ